MTRVSPLVTCKRPLDPDRNSYLTPERHWPGWENGQTREMADDRAASAQRAERGDQVDSTGDALHHPSYRGDQLGE